MDFTSLAAIAPGLVQYIPAAILPYVTLAGMVVILASAIANKVAPTSKAGKIIHTVALNFNNVFGKEIAATEAAAVAPVATTPAA